MKNFNWNINDYSFGFNGQEKEKQVTGADTHTSAEFWMYDSRAGRRWNVDPVLKVDLSAYSTFSNNPIFLADYNGADTCSSGNEAAQDLKKFTHKFIEKTDRKGNVKYDKKTGNPIMISNPNYDEKFTALVDKMATDPNVNVHFTTNYSDVADLKKQNLEGIGGSIFFDNNGNYYVYWNPSVVDKTMGTSGIFEETYHMFDALYTNNAMFEWANDQSNVAGWDIFDEARAKNWVANEINAANVNTYYFDRVNFPTHYGLFRLIASNQIILKNTTGDTTMDIANVLKDGYMYETTLETPTETRTGTKTYGGGSYSEMPAEILNIKR